MGGFRSEKVCGVVSGGGWLGSCGNLGGRGFGGSVRGVVSGCGLVFGSLAFRSGRSSVYVVRRFFLGVERGRGRVYVLYYYVDEGGFGEV